MVCGIISISFICSTKQQLQRIYQESHVGPNPTVA